VSNQNPVVKDSLTPQVPQAGDSLHGIVRLLPCPFCGLTDKDTVCPESTVAAVHAQDYYAMSSVICEGCQTTGPSARSWEQAIESWNTRKHPDCKIGHVVAFDCSPRTVTLQFAEMPSGKLGEFWIVLPNEKITDSPRETVN